MKICSTVFTRTTNFFSSHILTLPAITYINSVSHEPSFSCLLYFLCVHIGTIDTRTVDTVVETITKAQMHSVFPSLYSVLCIYIDTQGVLRSFISFPLSRFTLSAFIHFLFPRTGSQSTQQARLRASLRPVLNFTKETHAPTGYFQILPGNGQRAKHY